jgi:SAM-dependent methyltransferase
MEGTSAPEPGKVIVLGSGRGNDAIFFAQQGFDVTAVDFSPVAVEEARKAAEAAGVDVDFIQGDIFALDSSLHYSFDYVVEHTCFAAIPVVMKREYVQVVRTLLKPDGLYIGIFFAHGRQGGPPFTTSADEVRELFSPYFQIEKLEIAEASVPERLGKELFALMRPRTGEATE